ncbi:hypothetical protein Bhyg_01480 [Pseudolycoriella hygida]|uniref:Uncharacterized protein n=1 Tax=Pseudolycoriella hygida TaxID=35572 RepID=A0A9Q0S5V1_9DIPT|nr:hypothetical protein Bhyg_01480 [Pseudolycoriella hygida]
MAIILRVCFLVLFAILALKSVESATITKREIQTQSQNEAQANAVTPKPIKLCDPTFNCGWAVYEGFTRQIKYFMKNSCECPEKEHCVRVDDDPMISAYLYKCRIKRTTVPPQQNVTVAAE